MPAPAPRSAAADLSPGLKCYLYCTATLTGAIVLVVEILGAKMLTPWFGSSHFVWTAQIAITLLALAVGYYLGGRLADRYRRLSLVYLGLVGAAVYLGFTVLIRSQLAAACLSLSLPIGSVVASLALFFVPLILLAMVGPYFIRSVTQSVEGVGRTVGQLSALGTIGSVMGVVVTSYLLVPFVRDSRAMLGTAGVLVLLAAIYFVIWGRRDGGNAGWMAGALLVLLVGYAAVRRETATRFLHHVELDYANSHFGSMQVIESRDGRRRYYLNDLLIQNTYDPVARRSLSMFTYGLYHLSRAYTPELRTALCLGMGIGIVPRQLAADGVEVDVVEINPAVVPIAQRWFDFDPSAVRLFFDDARHYIRVATRRYDTVQLDAFLGDSSPSHLMTREAFTEIRRLLQPNGTLVINAFGNFEPERDFFATSLHRTLRAVFASVVVHASPGGNTLYVASDRDPLEFTPPASLAHVAPQARGELENALAGPWPVDPARGIVLTDDYNPVEFYDAPNRERTRRLLARSMQNW